jgi:parallel beta-helix repeat protein
MKKIITILTGLIISISFVLSNNPLGNGTDGDFLVGTGQNITINTERTQLAGISKAGTNILYVSDESPFSIGDEIIIITMQDPNTNLSENQTGYYEIHKISSIRTNEIVLERSLSNDFDATGNIKHQAVKIPNYQNVTVDGTLTCPAWDGQIGGILIFRANGTVNVNTGGVITATGKGYRGPDRQIDNNNGIQGESILGLGSQTKAANANGGAGGNHAYDGGGGGGYGTAGQNGNNNSPGGIAIGDSLMNRLYFGGAGGTGGDNDNNNATNPNGGFGGGIIAIYAHTMDARNIQNNGTAGKPSGGSNDGGAGGGAGGSVLINTINLTIDTLFVNGGHGYKGTSYHGGNGGLGRIRLNYNNLLSTDTITSSLYQDNFPGGIYHAEINDQTSETGPYAISADIFDNEGDAITIDTLYYRVNGGAYQGIDMNTSDGIEFTASIPGQSLNSIIDYYFYASDGTDDYFAPDNYLTEPYQFRVAGMPPVFTSIIDNHDGSVTLHWNEPGNLTNFVDYTLHRSEEENFIPGTANDIAVGLSDTSYTDLNLNDFHRYYYKLAANYDYAGTPSVNYTEYATLLLADDTKTTVKGYVYLEGKSNHDEIKVKFHPISPSAELDSTTTNALGYFEKSIKAGIYDVSYSYPNYQTYPRLTNTLIDDDTDLNEITLDNLGNTNIFGNVKGVWDGIYSIIGDITIPNGDTLIIKPGSEIRFLGDYHVYVEGYLEAIGAPADTILFTSLPANQQLAPGQWKGIDFRDVSDDNSILKYVKIRYADYGIDWNNANATLENSVIHDCYYHGLYLHNDNSDPLIRYVEVSSCGYADDNHHNIYVNNGDPTLEYVFSHHSKNSGYGVYFNNYAYASVKHSFFYNNSSYGLRCYNRANVNIDSSQFFNNNSWGIRIDYHSNATIKNSYVASNSGYGVCFNHDHNNWINPIFKNNIVENNSSWGIYCRRYLRDYSVIANNTVRNNGGGIRLYYYARPQIYENTVINNNSHGIEIHENNCEPTIHHNIIAYNNGDGFIKNNYSGSPTLEFNTIFGNSGDGIEVNNNGTHKINHNIIVNNNDNGVRSNSAIGEFQYNNVYGNKNDQVTDTTNLPVSGWVFIDVNRNGDPVDTYNNISLEPKFIFSDTLDFELQSKSPCINAGAASEPDPDGTPADLGAFYRELGNPYNIEVTGRGNQSVSLEWTEPVLDSIQSYRVFYKLSDSTTYHDSATTPNKYYTFTGLTNNVKYDFTVAGIYPGYVSGYAPKVSTKPGNPGIAIDPAAVKLDITTDTVEQFVKVTNNGDSDLNLYLPLGAEDGYAHFDGNSDYIHTGDHSHLEGMSALTIEGWVRNNNGSRTEPFGKHYEQYQLTMDINNGWFGMYKGYDNGQYQHFYGYYDFEIGTWYHLAVTWTGKYIKLYVNGILVNQYDNAVPKAISTNGRNFQMGRRADQGLYYLNGDLAEVRVWNVVRSAEAINKYKDQPLDGTEPGLVGYWPLHNDYNDHSTYNVSTTAYGHTYLNNGKTPTLPKLPFAITKQNMLIAPGHTDSVLFKFHNTGQTGTYVYTTPFRSNVEFDSVFDYELSLTYGSEVPSSPQHFKPVAETGIPYEIVVTDAEIDGVTIDPGDEIGVFDDTLCVGAAIFDDFNLVITAWQDNGPSKPGFTPGNKIKFVIFDTSAALEATVFETDYYIGDSTFGYREFSSVGLYSTIYKLQEISVRTNKYNLVSFNRLPKNSQAADLFGQIDSLEIAYDDDGNSYIPKLNVNSINEIDFRNAYYIFSTRKDTLQYQGTSINAENYNITLEPRKWNYISYLGENPVPITTAIHDSIKDSLDIVQTVIMDTSYLYVPGITNTIGDMQPGAGYLVATNAEHDISLNYQINNGFKSGYLKQATVYPEYFEFEATGLAYNIIVSNPLLDDAPLQPGDELGAFDNGICVGAAVYTGDENTVLTAWKKSEDYGLPGYTEDNDIRIKVYSQAHAQVFDAQLSPVNEKSGNLQYEGNTYAHVSLKSYSDITIDDAIAKTHDGVKAYPNPFTDQVTFTYILDKTTHVTLEISNIIGNKTALLLNKNQPAGKHELIWNGTDDSGESVPEGVYTYSITFGNKQKNGVIIVTR